MGIFLGEDISRDINFPRAKSANGSVHSTITGTECQVSFAKLEYKRKGKRTETSKQTPTARVAIESARLKNAYYA